MSQAKVDKYKQEKANRKEIMRKEKMQRTIRTCVAVVVAVVVAGWAGYSAYNSYTTEKAEVFIDYSAVDEVTQEFAETAE